MPTHTMVNLFTVYRLKRPGPIPNTRAEADRYAERIHLIPFFPSSAAGIITPYLRSRDACALRQPLNLRGVRSFL
jgi:hypothetical protein